MCDVALARVVRDDILLGWKVKRVDLRSGRNAWPFPSTSSDLS
jgi:hypothetical protein